MNGGKPSITLFDPLLARVISHWVKFVELSSLLRIGLLEKIKKSKIDVVACEKSCDDKVPTDHSMLKVWKRFSPTFNEITQLSSARLAEVCGTGTWIYIIQNKFKEPWITRPS